MRKFIFLLLIACSTTVVADDFDKGIAAFEAGDFAGAAKRFIPLAQVGDHRAMMALGAMYAGGRGVEKDFQQALAWFKEAARYNRPDANYRIGLIYEEGLGVRINMREAATQFIEAAKGGWGPAQFKVGELYRDGGPVSQDPIRAYAWMSLAAANGVEEAPAALATLKETFTPDQQAEADATLVDYQQRYPSSMK
ncbi:MAG: sel1 repeat family protein [Gammaproteobacteria bacterium]|nr:sel1 repeat family protein [Gammaproteobacteria bacterium]